MQPPHRLVPFHINCKAPSYFIVGGLVFTAVTVPYLRSEYGRDFDLESPVKLLDMMLHRRAKCATDQVVVVSQVLASDINIGYEDIMNTQVRFDLPACRLVALLRFNCTACATEFESVLFLQRNTKKQKTRTVENSKTCAYEGIVLSCLKCVQYTETSAVQRSCVEQLL